MSAEKILKAQARDKLKHGGWAKALFALTVVTIAYMLVECFYSFSYYLVDILKPNSTTQFIIEVAGGTVSTIVALTLSPVILGFFRMFYSDDKEYFFGDVLYYFSGIKQYSKAIRFVLSYIVRTIVPGVLFFCAPVALYVLKPYIFKGEAGDVLFNISFGLLIILSAIMLLIYNFKYFVSVLLLCENEHEKTSYYFKTSKSIMQGHSKDIIKLTLSFLGWIISCITALPMLYVIPYITQAMCLSGKWLTELSRNGQDL